MTTIKPTLEHKTRFHHNPNCPKSPTGKHWTRVDVNVERCMFCDFVATHSLEDVQPVEFYDPRSEWNVQKQLHLARQSQLSRFASLSW